MPPLPSLQLELGVKADPIEYRYSYPWLFRLLADEGVRHVQIGTFFEIYQLPNEFFRDLKKQADNFGLSLTSIFTAHRELGGFFREEPGFQDLALKNFKRLIEVGGLLGARSVGSNPGAVLRDQMGLKTAGTRRYIEAVKELMQWANKCGVGTIAIEPMSCLAEPPTLPDEMRDMADELLAFQSENPAQRSTVGYCVDVAHGYADRQGRVVFDNVALFEAALPYLTEIHLKNTDARFHSTFGFSEEERARGIVDVPRFRDILLANAHRLPVRELVGYLEIGGPKTGRDYSDHKLESELRDSIAYLRDAFPAASGMTITSAADTNPPVEIRTDRLPARRVQISPSLMCADLCNWEDDVRRLEALGVDLLHMDIMDAHFVPNMPLGLENLRRLRPKTGTPFDVHLMVDKNDFFVRQVASIGAEMISVHVESCLHLDRTLSLIRDLGAQAGAALNPATPLSVLEYVVDKLDFVLLMTVNPGYAGQAVVPATLQKIADCRTFLDDRGRDIPIEVDGNVSFENIPKMVAAGADILVTGTSSLFYRGGSLADNFAHTIASIEEGLSGSHHDRPHAPFEVIHGKPS